MADPLSTASGIIAVLQLTGTVVGYLHQIESAAKDRRKLLEELANTVTVLHTLKDTAERAEQNSQRSTAVLVLTSSNGALKQIKSALEELACKLAPVQGLSRLKRVVFWPFSKAEVREILSSIESQKLSLVLVLESRNIDLTQAVDHGVSDVHVDVRALRSNVEVILRANKSSSIVLETSESNRRADLPLDDDDWKVLDWLSQNNVWTKHSDVSQNRAPGTGEWILKTPEFRKWLDGTNKTLWCSGAPGVGKTVLASSIIDYMQQNLAVDNVLAYLYCSYQDPDQTALNLIGSVLLQLVSQRPAIPQKIHDMYKRHSNRNTRPRLAEILECLKSLVEICTRVFLIVDALDECSESTGARYGLLEALRALPGKVCLLATSRPVSTIGTDLEPCDRLDIRASDHDIQLYLEGQLRTERKLRTHILADPTLKDAIITSVIERAQGMFLLARLHIALLARKASRRDVRATLHVLPQELNEMYEETYRRILDQGAEDVVLADSIFLWVLRAYEPLSVTELQHALAVTRGETLFDDSGIVEEDILLSVCAGLVTIERESNTVCLVHWTARDYLESSHSRRFSDAHIHLATTCLTYLLLDQPIEDMIGSADPSKTEADDHPFLPYAANYWGSHFLEAHNDDVKNLAEKLLLDGGRIATVCNYMYSEQSNRYLHGCNGLHVAAFFGSTELAEMGLCAPAADVNLQSDLGQTPLSIACRKGSLSLVRMFLTVKDVDVNAGRDSIVGTALHSAAALGDPCLVKELLESGADINARSAKLHTALHVAAEAGNLRTVDLLLESGSEAKATTVAGTTALYRAVRSGNLDVFDMIFRYDKDVNVTTWDGWTPLHEAVVCNQAEVAKHLLMYGADTSIRTAEGESALDMARALGRIEIGRRIHLEQQFQGGQETPDSVVRFPDWGSALSVPGIGGHHDEQGQYHQGRMSMLDFGPPEAASLINLSGLPLGEGWSAMQGQLGAQNLSSPPKSALGDSWTNDLPSKLPSNFPSVEALSFSDASILDKSKRGSTTATRDPNPTDEAPYICSHFGCSFRTPREYDLSRHIKTHFPPPLDELFDCPSKGCPMVGTHGFRRKDHLNAHLANFHNGYVDEKNTFTLKKKNGRK